MRSESDQAAVAVEDLRKIYPKNPVPAVDGISFSVQPGEIFGLLGPNGAGKTTTIGVLTTRVHPTSGHAFIYGVDVVVDPVTARRQIAVVPQRSNLDRSLSIRQNLLFHASYHGVGQKERTQRAQMLLEQFGLAERADDKVDMFSGGQAQRAMIARALMHAPQVLFLDEPATGLDPAARLFVWARIRELRDNGVTMVLTTHDMDEAEALCDRVGIMDHGHLLALDTPLALMRNLSGRATLDLTLDPGTGGEPADAGSLLGAVAGVERVEPLGTEPGGLHLRVYLTEEAPTMVAPVAAALSEKGLQLIDLRIGATSLEDVFIALTGRSLR